MTKTLVAAGVAAALGLAPGFVTAGEPAGSCAAAQTRDAWPTFCSIPLKPTDARSPAAFRTSVVGTRVAGRRLVQATGPDSFGLPEGGADAFAAAGRAEATPPRPLPPPTSAAARSADLAEALKEVTPPPRHRRPLPDNPAKP